VRRRPRVTGPPPPAQLLAYDASEWQRLVDAAEYDPNRYRPCQNHQPYGEPIVGLDAWREHTARGLWLRARLDWCRAHGWPDGLTGLDLLREEVQARRRPRPGWRYFDAPPRTLASFSGSSD
jgi:hypothetical protein